MTAIYQPPPEHSSLDACDPGLLAAVADGQARLTPEQGLALFQRLPLSDIGRYADARCRSLHADRFRTYVIDRNINYTNVCSAKCTFCAFRRDAQTMWYRIGDRRIEELLAALHRLFCRPAPMSRKPTRKPTRKTTPKTPRKTRSRT